MKGMEKPISDTLRQAIIDSGLSLRQLARRAGIHSPSLVRFVNRNRGLVLESADRLAVVLGLRLVKGRPKTGRGAKKRT